MPPSTATQFGTLLREFRERAGLDQSQLGSLLEVSDLLIQKLEGGKRKPPRDLRFYHQLRRVPGLTGADITRLAIIARSNPEWDYRPPVEPQGVRAEVLTQTISKSLTLYSQSGLVEEAHVPLTTFVHTDTTGLATLSKRNPSPILDFPSTFVPIREILDHYPHQSVPEHARRVVAEGNFQEAKAGKTGVVVFDSSHAKLLFDALSNPDHKHRQRAVQLVRRFGAAVEKEKAQDTIKDKGIVIEQASQKYGVPASTLRDWEEMGLITVLYRGKGKQGIYLDEEAVARAVPLYHEAKQQGIQPARLLSELTQKGEEPLQLLQGITANAAAREFNVPTNFLLRWAKELGIIPILSQGTGRGSATFLDREKAREVAELYHEAKRQKIQPKKLLERISS